MSSPQLVGSAEHAAERRPAGPRSFLEIGFRAFLGLFVAAFLLWVVVKPTDERGMVWFSDLVLPAASLAAGCITLAIALTMRGRDRRSWLLIGLGVVAWGLGMAVWSYYELVLEDKTPFPSLADLGYLTMIPLMFAGLVTLPVGERAPEGRIKVALDAVIVMASIATLSWFVILGPLYLQDDKTWLEKVIGLAYPAGDLMLMGALVGGMARGWIARRDPALGPLVLGIALFSIADSGFAYLTMHNAYQSGNPIDVGWSTGFLLVAYAAVRRWAQGPTAPEGATTERPWLEAVQRLAPYVLVASVAGLVFWDQFDQGASRENVLLALALGTVMLVLARQFVTLRENELLNRELRSFSQRLEELVGERTARLAILHNVAAALSAAGSTEEVCRAGLQTLLAAEDGRTASFHLRDGDGFVAAASYPAAPAEEAGAVPETVARTAGEQVLCFPSDQPGRGSLWVPVSEQGQLLGFIGVADARLSDGLDTQTLATIGAEFGVAYQNQRRIEESSRRELERVQSAAQTDKLRALGQMAGGVAHDLNQSLAMVMGYADFARLSLEQGTPDVAKLRQMLDIVTKAAATGSETVNRLLIFARPRQETPPEPVDMATLLREVAQLTAPRWRDLAQAEGRQISLHVEGADDLTVDGWPAALRDAMTNLVFNAVDAMPQGGTIRLRATRRGDSVAVDVTDSGTGMSREVQAKIFEPFFTTKGEGGTGLGLAQVFSTVERHRGQITVQSTEGRGTTFRLTLPAVERVAFFRPTLPDPAATERAVPGEPIVAATERAMASEPAAGATNPAFPSGPAAAAPGQRRLRVLAVDDEPNLRDLVGLMLEREGHTVTAAASGEEALEHLEGGSFDLVISDVGMGEGINGWELGRQVRARFPGVRFALATGWGAQIDPAEARAIGIEAVIAKPYRAADLQRLSAEAR